MAADLGLTIAALASDDFFIGDEGRDARRNRSRARAGRTAARRTARRRDRAFVERTARTSSAPRRALAKSANVTLAVRNAPDTFAATAHDCKRVTKETDSAWLRYGLEPAAFDAASDVAVAARQKTVLALGGMHRRSRIRRLEAFRGFVVLDRATGDATSSEMKTRFAVGRSRVIRTQPHVASSMRGN